MTTPEKDKPTNDDKEPNNRVMQPERQAMQDQVVANLEENGATVDETFRDDSSTMWDVVYQGKRFAMSLSYTDPS